MSDLDFKVVAGTDFSMNFTALDADGVAINISGYTIAWYLKREVGEAAVLSKTTASGITITTAASGMFTVAVADTDTTLFTGQYYHEVQLTSPTGTITVLSDSNVDVGRITFRKKYAVA